MVPIRAAMEQHPIAVFLITVGKSSDETAYTIQKEDVMPNFPNISRNTDTVGRSEEIEINNFNYSKGKKVKLIKKNVKKTFKVHSTRW